MWSESAGLHILRAGPAGRATWQDVALHMQLDNAGVTSKTRSEVRAALLEQAFQVDIVQSPDFVDCLFLPVMLKSILPGGDC
jgi:hypothetical protein